MMDVQSAEINEAGLVDLEAWMAAHKGYWKKKHAGSGVDSLARYTQTLIAEVRRLRGLVEKSDA